MMKTIEANTPVTRFLLILKMGDQHHQLMTTIYTKGACYALCALLSSVFAGAQYFFVHDDEIGNHWITLIDEVYYDIRGALELSEDERLSLIPFNQIGLDNMLIYGTSHQSVFLLDTIKSI